MAQTDDIAEASRQDGKKASHRPYREFYDQEAYVGVAMNFISTEGQNENSLLTFLITTEGYIAALGELDYQFAKLGLLAERSADGRCGFEEEHLTLNLGRSAVCSTAVLVVQELPTSFQPARGTGRNNYSWHGGISVSASVPQPRNQSRVSLPVRCRPVA
ncbi:hypothetical protein [Lichenicoccus sp.]|uniref:hypothetical protein n=1 Tax=Lichenicoccus sp. TaxID=2781899 RepID=UPI003D0A8005